ncbi:MAG: hypothetical protein L3J59_14815, partial [Methylococcaceae bacterium]|nr:hypothetical protein [Methylococcaceae bacterium]
MNTIGFKRPVYDTSPITYGDWISSVESTLVESIIDVKSLCSTISIVIFANEASLIALQNTLSSIAKQSSKNWELFIVA